VILFAKTIAAFLFGRAMGRLYKKKYDEAARLLETVHRLDPTNKDLFCHLGQCYLHLGRHDEALELLARTYAFLSESRYVPNTDYERRDLIQFLDAFRTALYKTGQLERAREIAREAGEYQSKAK
jgi:thioredoxin-like negative regulator of GroEL